jgi:hypothetical protein
MVRKLETKETLQNKYGEDGLQWPVTVCRICCSGSWLHLQRHYDGCSRRLTCSIRRANERQGMSRNSSFLACRIEWPTASGLIFKTPTSWTWRRFLMKPDFICRDTSTHRTRTRGLLQILVPFTEKKVECGVLCHISA